MLRRGPGWGCDSAVIWLLCILASLGWWIYNRCIQAGRTGQSLGKKTLHLRLLSEKTGEPIGAGMAFARDICHILDSLACYIGWPYFPLLRTRHAASLTA